MAVTAEVTNDCKYIVVRKVGGQSGSTYEISPFGSTGAPVTGSISTSVVVPISSLSPTNGVFEVHLLNSQSTITSSTGVLVSCNIDCCLAKLTNELIECSCDCPKCATTLALAQKIFLLMRSAQTALYETGVAATVNYSAYLNDANSKYNKAKELCSPTGCGCDC